MVHLDVVRSSNAAVINGQPLVAVFVGGTAGIGEYALSALAAARTDNGKGLRAYIVGRNKVAAEAVVSKCLRVCPEGQFRFVRADDLSLLRDVDRVCAEIIHAEREEASKTGQTARVDFLVMTHAYLSFEARTENKEGLDMRMSLLYYSRMRAVLQLLPLLLASSLPAHIVSVFGPGRDKKIFPDDLSLRDPNNYNFTNMGSHAAYMTTFFFERLAAKYPGQLSLSHYFPSLVMTGAFEDDRLPTWFRWLFRALTPIIRLAMVPEMECGQRVMFHTSSRFPPRQSNSTEEAPRRVGNSDVVATSSDGVVGGGAYRTNWNGEPVPTGKAYEKLREEGISERCWNHTIKAFEEIEAGNGFTG